MLCGATMVRHNRGQSTAKSAGCGARERRTTKIRAACPLALSLSGRSTHAARQRKSLALQLPAAAVADEGGQAAFQCCFQVTLGALRPEIQVVVVARKRRDVSAEQAGGRSGFAPGLAASVHWPGQTSKSPRRAACAKPFGIHRWCGVEPFSPMRSAAKVTQHLGLLLTHPQCTRATRQQRTRAIEQTGRVQPTRNLRPTLFRQARSSVKCYSSPLRSALPAPPRPALAPRPALPASLATPPRTAPNDSHRTSAHNAPQ